MIAIPKSASRPPRALPLTNQTIPDEVLDVLRTATCDGSLLRLNAGQLDRALYVKVNDVLQRLGGKWKGGKVQAHVFDTDPSELLATVLEAGVKPVKNPDNFYQTPPDVVDIMIHLAGDLDRKRVGEFSAGLGAIALTVQQRFPRAAVRCYEINPERAKVLREAGLDASCADFLELDLPAIYDAVIINPPFVSPTDPNAYVAHIEKSWALLVPGGRLVSVAPTGFTFKQGTRLVQFREWVQKYGKWIPLAKDAFRESGTGVETVVIAMTKPAIEPDSRPEPEGDPLQPPVLPQDLTPFLSAEPHPGAALLKSLGFVFQVDDGELEEHEIYRGCTLSIHSPNGGMIGVVVTVGERMAGQDGSWWFWTEEAFNYADTNGAIAWAKQVADLLYRLRALVNGQIELPLDGQIELAKNDAPDVFEADLQSLAERINQLNRDATEAGQTRIAATRAELSLCRELGQTLLDAKAQLQHSEWLPWLQVNCSEVCKRGTRQLQRYMQLAKHWDVLTMAVREVEELSLSQALERIGRLKSADPQAEAAQADEPRPAPPAADCPPLAELISRYEQVGTVHPSADGKGFSVERPDLGNPFPLAFRSAQRAYEYWQANADKLLSLAERKPKIMPLEPPPQPAPPPVEDGERVDLGDVTFEYRRGTAVQFHGGALDGRPGVVDRALGSDYVAVYSPDLGAVQEVKAEMLVPAGVGDSDRRSTPYRTVLAALPCCTQAELIQLQDKIAELIEE